MFGLPLANPSLMDERFTLDEFLTRLETNPVHADLGISPGTTAIFIPRSGTEGVDFYAAYVPPSVGSESQPAQLLGVQLGASQNESMHSINSTYPLSYQFKSRSKFAYLTSHKNPMIPDAYIPFLKATVPEVLSRVSQIKAAEVVDPIHFDVNPTPTTWPSMMTAFAEQEESKPILRPSQKTFLTRQITERIVDINTTALKNPATTLVRHIPTLQKASQVIHAAKYWHQLSFNDLNGLPPSNRTHILKQCFTNDRPRWGHISTFVQKKSKPQLPPIQKTFIKECIAQKSDKQIDTKFIDSVTVQHWDDLPLDNLKSLPIDVKRHIFQDCVPNRPTYQCRPFYLLQEGTGMELSPEQKKTLVALYDHVIKHQNSKKKANSLNENKDAILAGIEAAQNSQALPLDLIDKSFSPHSQKQLASIFYKL